MPKKTSSGAPKKARWTTAQKASAPKKPHRGQSGPPPGGSSRPYAGGSSDRGPRSGASARPARDAGGYAPRRDDRPARTDRPSSDRPSYDRPSYDRPARDAGGYAPRRDDRPVRSDRPSSDRPSYDRPARDAGGYAPRRDDRPARSDRPSYDRPAREAGGYAPRRDDRPARAPRTERPVFDRSARTDRPAHDRTDRAPRTERPSYERPARDDRWNRRGNNATWEREDRIGQDAEAERMDADTWTKATRKTVSENPVEVAEDNGFAVLGLPERLVERLARDGITTPFPIQVATIPDALAGRDVLGRGQTGSGKTLAFGLPMLTRLVNDGPKSAPRRPRALVLVPTRELAMQVSDALEPLVHVVGLKHKLVAGGLSYTTQINALNRGVDLLIATPGRLNDLIERGAVELDDIKIAVLDEADHMADMGFLPEITTILDRMPVGGQRLLFSATLDKGVDGLVKSYLTDAVTHSTDDAKASVTTMEHHVLLIDPQHKKVITAEVANRVGRTLVFVRTKLGADRVAEQLREQGVLAAALHGGLNQGARNRVLGAFRDGSLQVLVATDVAARGIHVDDVSVVLQVDPPADHKDYLHRSGRTARAGDRGTVVTLALPHQRKGMERQLREAGVDVVPTRAVPGDAVLAAAGASTPSGVPVPDEAFRRLLEGEQKHRRGPGGSRGPRHGSKGGFRPQHGGARRFGEDRSQRRDARS